ncbi:MAG: TIGR01777 family oxidoreductase [Gemmatales bacterium]|nr:TIGR01777 family oxidoreductase [Gemmatales bacterium]MDW8386437.1 TIGR01777 family oxidoreductase [Gemmatales bacterium]
MRVFVAGGTGQIGGRLVEALRKRGDEVVVLSRNVAKAREKLGDGLTFVEGDAMQTGPWMDRVAGCQGVVNLVGEGIFARRWNDEFKKILRDSRIVSTTNIVTAIRKAEPKPAVLVQGSAVGYYGFRDDDTELTESSPPADDFMARLCVDWEAAAKPVEEVGVRLVLLRTGVVLDPRGGALPKLLTPFKMYLFGGPVGSGRQWVPWIHWADEVGLILWALDNSQVRGPLNAVAPQPARNKEMMQAVGAAMNRPSFWPTPGFMLRLGLGEVADVVVRGQKVIPRKALDLGYRFQFPEINAALRDLLSRS